MRLRSLLYVALTAVSASFVAADDKFVFAHFVAGNAAAMSSSDWATDISLARAAGIDGFALNIASADPNTAAVTATAFSAAETAGFKIFFSFDYLATGPWDPSAVIMILNQYTSSTAYFQYQNKPLASTFEGVNNINDWTNIKAQTGCFFMPDWSSIGPSGVASHLDVADGAFSWDAWPEGANNMADDIDKQWMAAIGSRPYMMPVSPWFYTNLPAFSKNWLWRGDSLFYDRWQQAIALQPALVEIITWNDYGESHYIGPLHPSGFPTGSATYVQNNPHEAWLDLLPVYTAQYKSNNASLPPAKEQITVWYKLNPGTACSANGTVCNNVQYQPAVPPQDCDLDQVYATAYVAGPSDVTVSIGGDTTRLRATTAGVNFFAVDLAGRTGVVEARFSRNGGPNIASVAGPAITTDCTANGGNVNWNAWVGSSS